MNLCYFYHYYVWTVEWTQATTTVTQIHRQCTTHQKATNVEILRVFPCFLSFAFFFLLHLLLLLLLFLPSVPCLSTENLCLCVLIHFFYSPLSSLFCLFLLTLFRDLLHFFLQKKIYFKIPHPFLLYACLYSFVHKDSEAWFILYTLYYILVILYIRIFMFWNLFLLLLFFFRLFSFFSSARSLLAWLKWKNKRNTQEQTQCCVERKIEVFTFQTGGTLIFNAVNLRVHLGFSPHQK